MTRSGCPASTAAAAAVRQHIANELGSRPLAATNTPALDASSASSRCAVQPPTASRVALQDPNQRVFRVEKHMYALGACSAQCKLKCLPRNTGFEEEHIQLASLARRGSCAHL